MVNLIAIFGLFVSQTLLISEVDAAKELETECSLDTVHGGVEVRTCCTEEVDTETGERTILDCWLEICTIDTGECTTAEGEDGNILDGLDRPTDEGVVLPTPPETTTKGDIGLTPLAPFTIKEDSDDISTNKLLGDQQEVKPVTPPPKKGFGITDLLSSQDDVSQTPSVESESQKDSSKTDKLNQNNEGFLSIPPTENDLSKFVPKEKKDINELISDKSESEFKVDIDIPELEILKDQSTETDKDQDQKNDDAKDEENDNDEDDEENSKEIPLSKNLPDNEDT